MIQIQIKKSEYDTDFILKIIKSPDIDYQNMIQNKTDKTNGVIVSNQIRS